MPASIPGNGKPGQSEFDYGIAIGLPAYAAVGCAVAWFFITRVIGLPSEPGMEPLVGLIFIALVVFWPAWVLLSGIAGLLWLIGFALRWLFFL